MGGVNPAELMARIKRLATKKARDSLEETMEILERFETSHELFPRHHEASGSFLVPVTSTPLNRQSQRLSHRRTRSDSDINIIYPDELSPNGSGFWRQVLVHRPDTSSSESTPRTK